MIVEPDFLEHWKTRLLVRLLGTEEAPLCVIRLWAHCQHRKTDRFTGWEPDVLASVCRWAGPAQTLWDSMLKTGFARIEEGVFIAHGWADCNASLVSAWANGKLGGRPKKTKENDDSDNHAKPEGNRSVIPSVTVRLSDREDREDREEKRREDNALDVSNAQPQGGVGEAGKPPSKRFAPPTDAEMEMECARIGLPPAEGQKFRAYYESNGWRVGKNPMKSWRGALVGWKTRWEERNGQHGNAGQRSGGHLTAAERRNALIAGADATQRQAELTAERERREQQNPDWVPI